MQHRCRWIGRTSDGQRAALKKIYAETVGKEGAIYPARPVGGEGEVDSWPAWITGGSSYATPQAPSLGFALATHFFKFLVFNDSSWDYSGYDVANARKDARLAATFMNATNPDLDAFKAKGRKLIVWHGWSDAALTALGSIEVLRRGPEARRWGARLLPNVLDAGCAALRWRTGSRYGRLGGDDR